MEVEVTSEPTTEHPFHSFQGCRPFSLTAADDERFQVLRDADEAHVDILPARNGY